MIDTIFKEFGLSDKEMKIYFCLFRQGQKNVAEISKTLNLPRATLYDDLERLKKAGFVKNVSVSGSKVFDVETLENLNLLYKQKIEQMTLVQKGFEDQIPELMRDKYAGQHKPQLHFYEGTDALHTMMNDLIVKEDVQVYSFWPIQSMISLMGDDYLTYLNKVRIKKNVHLKAIWPESQMVDLKRYPFMGAGKEHLREVRISPQLSKARLSYMVYADKVMVASSTQENFGFILQSKDMAEMLIDQFMLIWKISKPFEGEV